MSQEKAPSVVQFEVLEWIWHLAKEYDCSEEFRAHIKTIMANIAAGGAIDFSKLLQDLKEGNH